MDDVEKNGLNDLLQIFHHLYTKKIPINKHWPDSSYYFFNNIFDVTKRMGVRCDIGEC